MVPATQPDGAARSLRRNRAAVVLLLLPAALEAQTAEFALTPAAGTRMEGELGGDGIHRYRFSLTEGQYLSLSLDQRTADLAAGVLAPGSKEALLFDGRWYGPEPVCLIAPSTGQFALEVRPAQKVKRRERYILTVEAVRTPTDEDRKLIRAASLSTEAKRLVGQASAEALRKALKVYQDALPLWESLNCAWGTSQTLHTLGYIYQAAGDSRRSLPALEKALALREGAKDEYGTAETLGALASAHSALGAKAKALEYYDQALPMWRRIGDPSRIALTLNNLAAVYASMGESHRGLEAFSEALPLWRSIGSPSGEGVALFGTAEILNQFGERQRAIEHYQAALALVEKAGDRRAGAYLLMSLGQLHAQLGEYKAAIENSEQALARTREVGDRRAEGGALVALGFVHLASGNAARAVAVFEESLPALHAVGDQRMHGYALTNLSRALHLLGERTKAMAAGNEALAKLGSAGDRRGVAIALHNVGLVCRAAGGRERAAAHYEQALEIFRDIADRGAEAATLGNLARLDIERGELSRARARIEDSLALVEYQRARIGVQEFRASYVASVRDLYELSVDVLMRLHARTPGAGYDAAAFQASERGRARTLLDALAEGGIDIRRGVDAGLLDRERRLRQSISARSGALARLPANSPAPVREAARKAVEDLLREFQETQALIRSRSPGYAELTQPQPLDLAAIQGLLDGNTVLLEYALGEERSYLWAVTPRVLRTVELPPRAGIEARARRVYELLTARNRGPRGESFRDRQLRIGQAERELAAESAALSSTLLAPVASLIRGKRVVIAAEGMLQYLPFSSLPDPASQGGRSVPMAVNHEVVSLPSASVLALLRREAGGRKPGTGEVAILADPVFDAEDSRVSRGPGPRASSSSTAGEPQRAYERAFLEAGGIDAAGPLPRLPFTRLEAEAIAAAAPRGRVMRALDFEASRTAAMSPELARYRRIHIATHGLLNSEQPALSGVVLSLVDRQGLPQDGFLRLHEIYNLRLPADLIVLSACQTALGKDVKGEGLVGLTRGFMYAGATRVVASLWKVDDEATAHLMKVFYHAMLGRKPMSPAAALRAAQVAVWKERRWRSPYYWAAFVLQGDWH